MRDKYLKQVETLIEILPIALADKRMALKGGTAINLFHRDLPRLSVDIDLCYLPLEDRVTTFTNIHQILSAIKEELEKKLGAEVTANFQLDGKKEAKLRAIINGIEIKIEPNYTIRGSVFDPL
ncbi:MAG: nucleotidyl transferase AbiEii/AbiGii toxin family protein, partial [Bacteriovoracaceae bacterium]|nr:nucleotidyl transferase AbiEii/AbiGii toxin family protein [Bacteriovoracaceae bacterium]